MQYARIMKSVYGKYSYYLTYFIHEFIFLV